ncbi:MAG: 2-amino-4-hydroxy-6-hydroxymethyldihydropteridine diphosphokinase [Gammaproteobacteria bacterium]
MIHAYIGLGSNLDGPETQLSNATIALNNLPESALLACSSFYRSKPVGPQDQPDYINAVAKLDTNLDALTLLDHMQEIEKLQGRMRSAEHWGPRTLDLDLLLYGDETIDEERLIVPHQEMHKRGFVLRPLYELEPHLEVPGQGKVSELLSRIGPCDIEKVAMQ